MTPTRPQGVKRETEDWLRDLGGGEGMARNDAILELRDYLLRAVLVYLTRHRSDLAGYDFEELRQFAEDWAQLGVMQVLDKLDTFQGRSKFTTWAYRVAINLAAGELRRKRWGNLSLEALQEAESPAISLQEDESAEEPEDRAARQEVWAVVRAIIDEDLTERQRTALTRVVIEGVPVERVAEQLETNRNNIYKIVHDARKKLRRELEARHWHADEVLGLFGAGAAG